MRMRQLELFVMELNVIPMHCNHRTLRAAAEDEQLSFWLTD